MKKWLIPAAMSLALTIPMGVSAEANPIFAGAKVKTMNSTAMKKVVGQSSTSNYYAYVGNYYAGAAIQYAAYGQYLESFGTTYRGTQDSYYYNAYYYSNLATTYYYYAYIYN